MRKTRQTTTIEEPLRSEDSEPHWELSQPQHNVYVCVPRTLCDAPGFHADQLPHLSVLLQQLLQEQDIADPLAWVYTPMVVSLLRNLQPAAIVYDCMDELSAFHNAPPQLRENERELLRISDMVFTGGPSIYQAKKTLHPSVFCFPSSVDGAHFGKAAQALPEPEGQANISHPRLGFFGVIDERFDLDLLASVAEQRPDWQWVMVGPVVKIAPDSLPRLPNIHYLGQQKYEDLPRFLSGWDVCLLLFARNEATRFISPTKTLEYMAAMKPIVSTTIADVAQPYGHIIRIADSPADFLAACELAMNEGEAERTQRQAAMQLVLKETSWDATVAAMEDCLSNLLVKKSAERFNADLSKRPHGKAKSNRFAAGSEAMPVVIVGAGPTGLSAAYHLGEDALLIEKCDQVGGWCRSLQVNGFTFDFAGHIMFSNDPYVHEMYEMLLGDNVHWQDREAWIYSKQVYTRYPFQGSLYGLPPEVISECVVGAVEARFGSIKSDPASAPAPTAAAEPGRIKANGHDNENRHSKECPGLHGENRQSDRKIKNGEPGIEDCCGDGVLESTATLAKPNGHSPSSGGPRNFEEFIYKVWGAGIARHFAIPYNRKLWAVPLSEMETSWLGGRVPMPDLREMVQGALSPSPKPMGPNARFGYPLRGGFQTLMNGFVPRLTGPVKMSTSVIGFAPLQRRLRLSDGSTVYYDHLISTMPLPVLIRLAGNQAPEAVREAAARLRYVSVRCVHIGAGREQLTDKHWIYYPEDTVFHRIFVQGNASPHCNPSGGFGLTCEITYHHQYKPLPCDGEDLVQRCIAECRRVGILAADDPILATAQVDMPHAYVVYDHARVKNVEIIRQWLAEQNVMLAGRYSEWEYYNSDHAFLAGKKAAEKVRELQCHALADVRA